MINNGIPLVLFDRVIDDMKCNKVITDDIGGGYLACNHLINIGCKRIAILTTPDHISVGVKRKKGYLKALHENNYPIDEDLILKIDEKNNIEDQINNLFELTNPPDGIFGVNEIYAATAIKIAHKKGLKIPDDIAIMGFTNGLISDFTTPPLTTVAQHGFTMGEKALELLLDEIEYQDTDYIPKTEVIKTDLIMRNSTKKNLKNTFK